MFHVQMQSVDKWFGDLHVLRNISLTVTRGERIVICGPSGSGKSTLIRCINRLEPIRRAASSSTASNSARHARMIDAVRRRSRHGVPAVQPVSASDDSRKLHARADVGAGRAEGEARETCACTISGASDS